MVRNGGVITEKKELRDGLKPKPQKKKRGQGQPIWEEEKRVKLLCERLNKDGNPGMVKAG